MARSRTLDEYATRRLRIAAGPMMRGDAFEENLAAMKSVYLQPTDALAAQMRASAGRFVSFANYDYLGFGEDVRVRQAAAAAALEHGVGANASRLVGGSRTMHDDLERELAEFLGVDATVSLVSGYLTNASLIGHLLTNKNDQVFVDDLSHNSIMVGTDVSRAAIHKFAHNDLDDLEAQLDQRRMPGRRALIVVEGLYSMDGDIPDLPRLLELRDRYDAWLLVDEAHSIGVLGATGRGIAEHFGVDPRQIDFIVGTLSKTFGCSGGFIAGHRRVIDWLRFTLPAFVFSVALSPMVVAAVREGLSLLRSEPSRVAKLQRTAQQFLDGARERGLDVGDAIGAAVMSVQFPDHAHCMKVAEELLRAGYYAPPITQLAVPTNKPRIRFFLSASHTAEEIIGALDVMASVHKADTVEPLRVRETPISAAIEA